MGSTYQEVEAQLSHLKRLRCLLEGKVNLGSDQQNVGSEALLDTEVIAEASEPASAPQRLRLSALAEGGADNSYSSCNVDRQTDSNTKTGASLSNRSLDRVNHKTDTPKSINHSASANAKGHNIGSNSNKSSSNSSITQKSSNSKGKSNRARDAYMSLLFLRHDTACTGWLSARQLEACLQEAYGLPTSPSVERVISTHRDGIGQTEFINVCKTLRPQ
mmetsp:Transcript_21870/g.32710  ORF Transcript_21870/g.32710 Transcript_21870/m.32710 type:complete len:218 (+) Transcript_21870:69-722(+)